jgi:catechol 2,3-dioxygenase-like lactoylglutathione lyase family enzyme
MKIRLQEIELGAISPDRSKDFYADILGLGISVDQPGLKVFNSGVDGVDFNLSTHISPQATVVSFLTDSLREVMETLKAKGIVFSGPRASHLGMETIEFTDPDGHLVRVNQPTDASPSWMKI